MAGGMACRSSTDPLGRHGLLLQGSGMRRGRTGGGRCAVLFLGDDWAEAHHDIELVDEDGRRLARRRLPEGVEGLAALHALVADTSTRTPSPTRCVVGIETDRGPWVQALIAAGYTVYAINPLQVARYRERHGTSGAKSDPGDAHVLAELVRLDRAHHRPVAGDSALAEHVKVLDPHPSVDDLVPAAADQRAALDAARVLPRPRWPPSVRSWPAGTPWRSWPSLPRPRPAAASRSSKIAAALRRAGRQRNLEATAERIQAALRAPQLAGPPRRGRRLHRRGALAGRRDRRAGHPDRGAPGGGGGGFWPAPGR